MWRFRALVFLQLLGTAICSAHQSSRHHCGTPDPHPTTLLDAQARLVDAARLGTTAAAPAAQYEISVVWHIIYYNESLPAFKVSKDPRQLANAIAVLNKAFAIDTTGPRYTFRAAGAPTLYKVPRSAILPETCYLAEGFQALKRKYHIGDACTLNLYVLDWIECPAFFTGVWGVSAYPWDLHNDPLADGVVLNAGYVFRGPISFKTVSHEVGHWLGLLHTFQSGGASVLDDGCTDRYGDFVSDTPKEQYANDGKYCKDGPLAVDSCPNDPGVDPWWNLMSYYMCAAQRFSPGQFQRARLNFELWRKPRCRVVSLPTANLKFGPQCAGSRATVGGRLPCCDTTQGFYCYKYSKAGVTRATCMTPDACAASASTNPGWACNSKAACNLP